MNRTAAIFLALALSATGANWYNSGGIWTNRKTIVIDHRKVSGAAPLTNFPVLISAVDDDLKLAGKGGAVRNAGGSDILFTAADGVTKLAHEIESYSSVTGALTAWVNLPQLSPSADTIIYVYFGNAASAQLGLSPALPAAAAVWNSNYYGVYHLADPDAGDLRDSTSHGFNLIRGKSGRPALDVSGGQIGGAQQFGSGHSDYALTGADDVQSGPATVSLWLKRGEDYSGVARAVLASSSTGSSDLAMLGTPDANTVAINIDGAYRTLASKVSTEWNYVAVTRNGGTLSLYFNGKLAQTVALSSKAALTFRGLGSTTGAGSLFGEIDEVRWSHIDRSADWIATEFNNQSAPASFANLGGLEPALALPVGVAQLFQKDDAVAAGQGVEDIAKRTLTSRTFHNTSGSITTVIGNNLNQDDGKGNLSPALSSAWQDGVGGWEVRGSPFKIVLPKSVKGHDAQHVYTGADGKQHTFTLGFPGLTYVRDTTFRFAAGNLTWNLVADGAGTEFSAVVRSAQGAQTYAFDFDVKGAAASVNGNGAVVADDGVSLSRPLMIRADGRTTRCSAWAMDKSKKTLSFSCDDTAFPAKAYPYIIDPTLNPAVANLQSCTVCNSGCTNSCTSGSYTSDNENDSGGWFHSTATWTMDTSSIPSNATVSQVLVSLSGIGGSSSATYGVSANGFAMGNCSVGSWNCPNLQAPTGSVVRGGVTSLTGNCGNCGGSYNPDTGDFGYGTGFISSFSMAVTYGTTNVTIATNPAGRTITADGANYTAPYTFQWVAGSAHTIAVPSPQAGGTGTQYLWTQWSDGGAVSHSITTPGPDTTYTATLKTQNYYTAASGIGGLISPSSGWYDSTTNLSVSATPYIGYPFAGFSGDLSGTASPQGLYMTAPRSVTANFAPATAYGYYYIDELGSVNGSNWNTNGTVTTGTGGFTSADANGGSLISSVAIPGGGSLGESQSVLTLTQSGGVYTAFLMANSTARLGPVTTGTFYAAELQNPTFTGTVCNGTLALYKVISGSVTSLGTVSAPCRNGMLLRMVKTSGSVVVYSDNVEYFQVADASITTGQPGVGVRSAPAGNSIAQVQLGAIDTTAPSAVDTKTVATSSFANRVDFHFAGTSDNSGGSGIAYYCLARVSGPTQCSRAVADLSDSTVAASTTYQYQLQAYDFHLNNSSVTISVTTPPASAVDPRRVGVKSTGAYWGGMGENLDVLSGNLNFSVPLVKAQGRGGWGVGFSLSYNSDNWRQDGATTWNLGEDVGYGYGWKLLAGSLTPVWGNSVVDHYTFTDASGAEYWLTVNNGGVWTSTDGFYGSFDSNTNRLYFNDGSFWAMGCVSGGAEADAGVLYPTQMQDSNGNQVMIRYAAGAGLWAPNTSARILQIEDVRAKQTPVSSIYDTYEFAYDTTTPPHLTSISNRIGTSEGYTFTYTGAQTLSSPFGDNTAFAPVSRLTQLSLTGLGMNYQFLADASGGLTKVTFPYGGYQKWSYGSWNYTGSRKQMEVGTRTISKDGTVGSEVAYSLFHKLEPNDGSHTIHGRTDLLDPSNTGGRTWFFGQTAPIGYLTKLERFNSPNRVVVSSDVMTWAQDAASRWYVGATTSTMDGTATKKSAQTLDVYGNPASMQVWDFGLGTSRTYTNTFLTDSNYTSRYIRNRLVSSSVTGGGQTVTLVTNTYDNGTCNGWAVGIIQSMTGVREHDDANYPSSFLYRGNLVMSVTPAGTSCTRIDNGGNVVTSSVNGIVSSATVAATTNFAAPTAMTVGGLSDTIQWSSFLGMTQNTGPNGDTASTAYDSYARPATSTSPMGAVTTYTYASAAPWMVTATTNGRWARTTLDGFGRTVKAESGYGSTTVSQLDTMYDSCGCSPMGKTKQVSMPHASGAGAVWTTYNYDGLGRTTSVVTPDGSATTYSYSGNQVTPTDEAGKWKTYTMDGFGNLTAVVEPNPSGGNFTTTYTYDVLNHLIAVNMPRPTGTQTRTFNYGTPPGAFLLSATNPESGTVSYTYNGFGKVATKTDAKGQKIQYTYDSLGRATQVQHFPGSFEDTCQQVNFTYDSNSDGSFTYLQGRLATRQYSVCPTPGGLSQPQTTFYDMLSYTSAGQVTKKRFRVARNGSQADLDMTHTYDTEGKMLTVTYPTVGSTTGASYAIGYDSMGRPLSMNDQLNANAVVNNVSYGPAGELLSITGQSFSETRTYNSRLQMTAMNGVTFSFPAGANNGKISSQTDSVSGETVTYQYDSLNRLIQASSNQAWAQGFNYDGFGNLTQKTGTNGVSNPVDPATNRLMGYGYDANGNQTQSMVGQLSYDVENRVSAAQNSSTAATAFYGYDADNMRVYAGTFHYDYNSGTSTLTGETVYLYGINGQKAGVYNLTINGTVVTLSTTTLNVYFGGKLIRKTTTNDGSVWSSVQPDRLSSIGKYFPYGEDRTGAGGSDSERFATYTRDSQTGLDYAMNRYYNNVSGRYMTVDSGAASAGNPSSFNRYNYGVGDPIGNFDPDGRLPICSDLFTDYDGGGDFGGASCSSFPLIYLGPIDPSAALTPRERAARLRVMAFDSLLRAVAAAAIASRQENQDLGPFPAYLRVTRDCYALNVGATATTGHNVYTRYITYELYGSDGHAFKPSAGAVITELLFPISGIPGPASSSKSGKPFDDTISTGSNGLFTVLQQFQVAVGGTFGVPGIINVPVFVIDRLGRAVGSQVLNVNPTYTDINGDPNLDSGGVPHPCN